MDVTPVFKACVKTVKTRHKIVGNSSDNYRNNILSHSKPKTEFSSRAKDVVSNINKLRDLLLEHRKDYINASSLTSDISRMTDQECDQIDNETQIFMRTCSDTIKAFRTEMVQQSVCSQVREHRTIVLELMEEYLKSICKIYSEQRAIRVKRLVDKRRLARLEPEGLSRSSTPSSSLSAPTTPERSNTIQQSQDYHRPTLLDSELSPEEIQMFELENARLFDEMNSMANEVRQIEGKVVEISRLQEIFSEKVLQQEKDIDRLGDVVIGSTENIKDANEEIRSAMKNNAGFRVWILFFLVVMSFSLLFLDWYNQ